MMCTCFYYIYHRIAKNTSFELKLGQSGCFRVSFEFSKYQVILGIFGRFMGKKYYLQPQRTGGSPGDLRHVFCPARIRASPRTIFFSPSKNMYKMMNLHGCYIKRDKRLRRGVQKTSLGSPGDPPPTVPWGLTLFRGGGVQSCTPRATSKITFKRETRYTPNCMTFSFYILSMFLEIFKSIASVFFDLRISR